MWVNLLLQIWHIYFLSRDAGRIDGEADGAAFYIRTRTSFLTHYVPSILSAAGSNAA